TLGLSTVYKDDEEARFICQQLMALALLPLNKVEPAFQALADNHPESLDELFEYFETFWMKTTSIDLWNVFDLKTRTNNNAEGYHNRFSHRIDKRHPSMWHFIRVLQEEEEVHLNQHVQHVRMGKKKVQDGGGLDVRPASVLMNNSCGGGGGGGGGGGYSSRNLIIPLTILKSC
ncbi:unnamed protein product, partial [Adineta ricciae]